MHQGTDHNLLLQIRQVPPNTRARPLAERHHVRPQRRAFLIRQPPLRPELVGVAEQTRAAVQTVRRHGDGHVAGDVVAGDRGARRGRFAREAERGGRAQAHRFFDAGAQVFEPAHLRVRGRARLKAQGGGEFAAQLVQDARVAQDVVEAVGHGCGGRVGAGVDHDARFLFQFSHVEADGLAVAVDEEVVEEVGV